MSKPDLSAAIQDYLKEIYKLEAEGTRPTTTAIAKRMGVAPSSATSMLKKLAALGLAEHSPYRGVELSEDGTKIALEVIRHHRLLEQYLAETLGLPIDAVHAEADRIWWPDFSGNNMFNSIGNLIANPNCGLLFVDFERAETLQIEGSGSVRWGEERRIEVKISLVRYDR